MMVEVVSWKVDGLDGPTVEVTVMLRLSRDEWEKIKPVEDIAECMLAALQSEGK